MKGRGGLGDERGAAGSALRYEGGLAVLAHGLKMSPARVVLPHPGHLATLSHRSFARIAQQLGEFKRGLLHAQPVCRLCELRNGRREENPQHRGDQNEFNEGKGGGISNFGLRISDWRWMATVFQIRNRQFAIRNVLHSQFATSSLPGCPSGPREDKS